MRIVALLTKPGNILTDPKQIKEIYAHIKFAALQKNILGKFDKNGKYIQGF
ncbi:hypothetical protein RCA_01135 [Rickettsia canadensis str. CA410]|uniref:Uncharacterized protein n=1 Tax=Rickettsia canadensis str. CA410 TaxID=1105107 RepID=A0ABM5MR01_RICCA|nr:hypothetical protein RCA_01135 [Rickettsia canadensis str. CA410]